MSIGDDNILVARLGAICREAGAANRTDVGDDIDRGLILLRLLAEQGLGIHTREKQPPQPLRTANGWTSRKDFDPEAT